MGNSNIFKDHVVENLPTKLLLFVGCSCCCAGVVVWFAVIARFLLYFKDMTKLWSKGQGKL